MDLGHDLFAEGIVACHEKIIYMQGHDTVDMSTMGVVSQTGSVSVSRFLRTAFFLWGGNPFLVESGKLCLDVCHRLHLAGKPFLGPCGTRPTLCLNC